MEALTERQKEVYDFIVKFRNEKGYSPSLREIGKGCYISSVSTVSGYIDRLVKKGYLDYIPNASRTLTPKR